MPSKYKRMTVAQLQAELCLGGMRTTGRKADLVQCLLSLDALQDTFPMRLPLPVAPPPSIRALKT